jgi:hypothetical protein
MTSLRTHVLVGGVMLLTAGALAAQERPAVAQDGGQKTNQKQADPGVRPAFGEGGARPGEYVAVTRKDGQKMIGTLVWIDEKNNRLYLRPQPGQTPIAIARDDVNTVAVQPRDNGIRTASTAYTTGYEIHSLEIFNGPNRSFHYFDRTLSPDERARLAEIEKAADDVVRKRDIVDNLNEELRNQAQYGNQSTVVSTSGNGYGYGLMPFAFMPINYYTPYAYAFPYYSQYFPYAYGFAAYGGGAGPQNTTVVVQSPSGSSASPGELLKALHTAEEQLAQARSNYTAARNLAIFDGQGRVIAVRLDAQPMEKAAQPATR